MFYTSPIRINVLLLFVLLFLACFNQSVTAQIVNIEDRRIEQDSAGWQSQLDLGGNYTQNSSKILRLSAGFRVDRTTTKNNQWLLMGNYLMVSVNSRNILNGGFVHLRHGLKLTERISWEAFTQLQYDENINLDLRWLLGTGPRLRLLAGDGGHVYLGILYMHEYDELRNVTTTFNDHRLSTYISLNWQLAPSINFSNTSYYQPRLIKFDKGRIASNSTLQFDFSKKLSFTTRFNLTFDNRIHEVFPEVPEVTFLWQNGLRWRF